MKLKVSDIEEQLEFMAPPYLAAKVEFTGLQLGNHDRNVRKLAVAVGPSPKILERCASKEVDLLVVYRPLFMEPMMSLINDSPGQNAIFKAISAQTSIYVLGTACEAVPGGVTDILAQNLGFEPLPFPLIPRTAESMFKIAVFTPPEAVDVVRDAMAEAGGGVIGGYSHCSFASEGTGTFIPLPGAKPYSGEGIGKLAKEKELRVEMQVPESLVTAVVAAMLGVHPYDEVAYDIYPILKGSPIYGLGRLCQLQEPVTVAEMADMLEQKLGIGGLRISGDEKREVFSLALSAGEGDMLIEPAAEAGADLVIAGDLGLLGFEDAEKFDIAAIDAPTKDLLTPGMKALHQLLKGVNEEEKLEVMFFE